ncbi:very short patch repair endonuclease [Agromyces sp. GXQ0307]|uniref:very short patch repair endonuclease n=1 Tax=Agromyces sp. GXQ0307 TaxID=3377835 RepID=UPI00383BB699
MGGQRTSWATSEGTRKSMVANRGRDTGPELAVRRLLYAQGLRYRVNSPPVKGLRRSADIVFTRAKLAVFIDGCFWHGCPDHYQRPGRNQTYWDAKVQANRARDRNTDDTLGQRGWTVLRVWEHDVRADPEGVGARIRDAYEQLSPSR